MNIVPSPLNQALSGSLLSRIAADQFRIASQTYFWRLIGLGFLALGAGGAIGIGFWGYSYVTRYRDNLTGMSAALSKALDGTELRGTNTGTVQISPNEIALAKDQTIKLDADSRIGLDSDAKVLADGTLHVQVPTISTMRAAPEPNATQQKKPIITNFVVFKSVPYEKGSVLTGWKFFTSAQARPTNQYCYYSADTDNPQLNVVLSLADDGIPRKVKTVPDGFDVAEAQSKCVWFK